MPGRSGTGLNLAVGGRSCPHLPHSITFSGGVPTMRARVHFSGRYREVGRSTELRLIAPSSPAAALVPAAGVPRNTPTIISIAPQQPSRRFYPQDFCCAADPAATEASLKGAGS